MERFELQISMIDPDATQPIPVIGSPAPSPETPQPMPTHEADLVAMLQWIGRYFDQQTGEHDLVALNFSLIQLFSRVDVLYYEILPSLSAQVISQTEAGRGQRTWLQLQAVQRILDRLAPLCYLLSDTIECLLDALDNEDLWLHPPQYEATLLAKVHSIPANNQAPQLTVPHTEPAYTLTSNEAEHWQQAATALMDRVLVWQKQYQKLVPFAQQFSLGELDVAFSVLLDSASAIFGDILPNFRELGPEKYAEISALLCDLLQQSDQMLIQLERIQQPLSRLLRYVGGSAK